MAEDRRGLAIILHSGSYDRVYNALLIALTALALGRQVRLLFTYWALEYVKRDGPPTLKLDNEALTYTRIIERNIASGRIYESLELLESVKELEGRIYTCIGSMELLGITREQLIDQVDASIGMAEFLRDSEEDQLLFV